MNFNRDYEAIEKLWKRKFANQVPKKELSYVSSRIKNLKTSFQNENYGKALNITRTLFGYFGRILFGLMGDSHPLSWYASGIAVRLWSLESILETKVK